MKVVLFLILLLSFGCQGDNPSKSMPSSLSSKPLNEKDNFDDFKKQPEEGCEDDSKEKMAKIMEAEPEEINLLEGDAGCDTEASK